jgi:hypothetical protein
MKASGSGGDFFGDCERSLARIFRAGDGATDDKVVSACGDGLRRSGNAGLVVRRAGGGADPGDNDEKAGAAGFADGSDFVSRGDDTVEAGFLRELGEFDSTGRRRTGKTDFGQSAFRPCWSGW